MWQYIKGASPSLTFKLIINGAQFLLRLSVFNFFFSVYF